MEVDGEKKKYFWCGIELFKIRVRLFDIILIFKNRVLINYFFMKNIFNLFIY